MVFLCRNTLFPCACCMLLIEIYKSCSKNLANTLAYFIVLLSFTYPLSVLLVASTHHPRHPSPLLFHPCLKPFSAHPSNGSLPFLQDWLHGFPTVFTDTSEHIRQYPGSENYAMQYKKIKLEWTLLLHKLSCNKMALYRSRLMAYSSIIVIIIIIFYSSTQFPGKYYFFFTLGSMWSREMTIITSIAEYY